MSEDEAINFAFRVGEDSGDQSEDSSASRNPSFSARVP
jgi:hypothetical protein